MRLSRLFAALIGSVLAFAITAADAKIYVVANPKLGVTQLTQVQLANLYTGKASGIHSSVTPVLFDHDADSELFQEFYSAILNWTPSDVSSYWASQTFSTAVSPPHQLDSDQKVIAEIKATPGGIGYVDSHAVGPW